MVRWAEGLGLLGGLATFAAVVFAACLPDIPVNLCGNGHIDVSANESCDPGPNPNPGCSANCAIICGSAPGDRGTYFYAANSSRHCYFTSPPEAQDDSDGAYSCVLSAAHLVTFVDDDELGDVIGNLSSAWPRDPRFWVGFQRSGRAGPYFAASPNEPGWNVPVDCPGCFLHGAETSVPPIADGGLEAGPPSSIVATQLTTANRATMEVLGPSATADVVCEREPVGSRSVPCFNASFCFTVLATLGANKGYLFDPIPATVSTAESTCRALNDAGGSSLVVFESRAEREQVIYELSQLYLLPNGGEGPPGQFWIGLHTEVPQEPDGGMYPDGGFHGLLDWVWDDGIAASSLSTGPRPSVWGNRQGRASAPAHAYINLQSTYDTGLAYVIDDSESNMLPFVCQYR